VRAVDPDAIHVNAALVTCRNIDGGVEATFSNGETATADALIGADGIRSKVRDNLFGLSPAQFTGYVAWRGLVPAEGLPELSVKPMSAVWVGPGHQFVRYLVRAGTIVNFVGFGKQPGWQVESWTERATIDEVLREFEGWHEAVTAIIRRADPNQLFKWAIFDRAPMDTFVDGRIALIGDAAHPMTPFIGQGAGIAVEDAMVVARALHEYPDVETAFQRYQAARVDRGRMAQLLARESAINLDEETPTVLHAVTPEIEDRRKRVRAVTSYDPVTVPV
jgi:salicylate hydroxylase